MPEPYADTLAKVAMGRTVLVARLRTIATHIEELPLDGAAEVLVLLEPALAALEQQAVRALERVRAEEPRRRDPRQILPLVEGHLVPLVEDSYSLGWRDPPFAVL